MHFLEVIHDRNLLFRLLLCILSLHLFAFLLLFLLLHFLQVLILELVFFLRLGELGILDELVQHLLSLLQREVVSHRPDISSEYLLLGLELSGDLDSLVVSSDVFQGQELVLDLSCKFVLVSDLVELLELLPELLCLRGGLEVQVHEHFVPVSVLRRLRNVDGFVEISQDFFQKVCDLQRICPDFEEDLALFTTKSQVDFFSVNFFAVHFLYGFQSHGVFEELHVGGVQLVEDSLVDLDAEDESEGSEQLLQLLLRHTGGKVLHDHAGVVADVLFVPRLVVHLDGLSVELFVGHHLDGLESGFGLAVLDEADSSGLLGDEVSLDFDLGDFSKVLKGLEKHWLVYMSREIHYEDLITLAAFYLAHL